MNKRYLPAIVALMLSALFFCACAKTAGVGQKSFVNPYKGAPKWVRHPDLKEGIGVAAVAPYSKMGAAFQEEALLADAHHKVSTKVVAVVHTSLDMLREEDKFASYAAGHQVFKSVVAVETSKLTISGMRRRELWFNENTGELWGWYCLTLEDLKNNFHQAMQKAEADRAFIERGVKYLDENVRRLKEQAVEEITIAEEK